MGARLASLAIVASLAAAPAAAQERDVEAAFDAIQRAVEARDAAALERLVHAKFEMLHGLGQIERRDTWLALVKSGRLPRQTAEIREFGVTIRIVGTTAVRGSIVRFRDAKLGRDTWLRGTATFVREQGAWRQLRQQSTLLSDAPLADAGPLDAYLGSYAIPGRDGFRIDAEAGLLTLRWATGAALPLVPLGEDRFAAGPVSTVQFVRDTGGRVTAMERHGPEGKWWTATRN